MMSRHPADLLSLAFGMLFAGIGLVLLTGGDAALSLAWIGPMTALALGILLIVAARATRSAPDDQPSREG